MAVYTIELDSLIKSGYDIGLTDYPLPNFLRTDDEKNAWRDALNKKIIAHYRFNEICCTPPDRFKHFLNTTMNEIMPLKNLMYQALNGEWEFNTGTTLTEIIADTSANKRTGSDITSTVNSGSNTSNNYNLEVSSATPGQMLNIETDIANNTYADAASKNKANGTETSTSNGNTTTTYNTNIDDTYGRNRTVTGLNGKSYIELFKQYSEAMKNIDMEVIAELTLCFMGVF